ncbi:MerR family transcriptional regulator [Oleispirillum naphthae]|uniref:MerR family transcriptional regulator n=1 Tax=Oleispirillum naphthae TaxID=2838853 RepID=UPI0030825B9C
MTEGPENHGTENGARRTHKSEAAFRTISEVSAELDVPQHVLRFWETRFAAIQPMKRGGGRRYYRPEDVQLLKAIRTRLYDDGFTIKGVKRLLGEKGTEAFVAEAAARPAEAPAAPPRAEEQSREPALPFDLLPPAPRAVERKPALSAKQHAEVEAALHTLETLKATLDQTLASVAGSP